MWRWRQRAPNSIFIKTLHQTKLWRQRVKMQFGLTIGSTLRCTVVYCDVEIIRFTCMLENRKRRNNRLQPITVVGFGMHNMILLTSNNMGS